MSYFAKANKGEETALSSFQHISRAYHNKGQNEKSVNTVIQSAGGRHMKVTSHGRRCFYPHFTSIFFLLAQPCTTLNTNKMFVLFPSLLCLFYYF